MATALMTMNIMNVAPSMLPRRIDAPLSKDSFKFKGNNMSENVTSFGFMAPLVNPIKDAEDRETLTDKLYFDDTGLCINYEGTLIYNDFGGGYDNKAGIFFLDLKAREEFLDTLASCQLTVDENNIKFYACNWYNGTDSHMDEMTLERFLSE